VTESWDKTMVTFSTSFNENHEHPKLDNSLSYPCWAAASADQQQVSPRPRCASQRWAEWLSRASVVLLVRWAG
jgi:hypothetical protein